MSLLSYIFPQTIVRLSSRYNKEIRINEEHGKLKLLVNGSIQSGRYIETLWIEALQTFGLPQSYLQGQPLQILILGVGGGSVIRILHSYFPNAHITAVDIDPVMIEISQKYFGLDQIAGLHMICADGKQFVAKAKKSRATYDLVIVDVFIGPKIPDFILQDTFLLIIRSLLSQNGRLIINYLRELVYAKKSDQLFDTLTKIFPVVDQKPLYNNRFLSASMVKSEDVQIPH